MKIVLKVKSFIPSVDRSGKVAIINNRFFRFINKSHEAETKILLESGLIDELTTMGLFPKTSISNYCTPEYSLVLEHHKIDKICYAQEWTFGMLKDAAICTMQVNKIANKYGYQILDAHTSNIVFEGNKPYFVDFGSFSIKNTDLNSWAASEEFLRTFYFPLKLWSKGLRQVSSSIVFSKYPEVPLWELALINNPFLRLIPYKLLTYASRFYFPFSRISAIPDHYLRERLPRVLHLVIKFIKKFKLLPFQIFHTQRYIKTISSMKSHSPGYWNIYQNLDKGLSKNNRFKKILVLLKKYHVRSIVDLASNSGLFSIIGIKNKYISSSICIDNEESALDKLYQYLKRDPLNIMPVVQNFIFPLLKNDEADLNSRFVGDAAVALAITHHLLLNQNIPIQLVFERIGSFSKKYVLIEFMPLGLWNGSFSPPTPAWYTMEYFEREFRKQFKLIRKIRLEENRILFFGIKKR